MWRGTGWLALERVPRVCLSSFPALLLPAWSSESLKLYIRGLFSWLACPSQMLYSSKKKKFLNFDLLLSERMKVSHAEVEDHSV